MPTHEVQQPNPSHSANRQLLFPYELPVDPHQISAGRAMDREEAARAMRLRDEADLAKVHCGVA